MGIDVDLSKVAIAATCCEEQRRDDKAMQRPAMREPAFVRQHELWCTAITHDCWPFTHAVMPTAEDIRYANELRVQLRQRYMRIPRTSPRPWCVDVD